MPTTTELREMESVEWALVLSIEDLPYAWTTHEELVGTSFFADGREVLQGLVPFDYTIAIDAYADFFGKRSTTEITIEDLDGRVAQMLAGFDGTEAELELSVMPADNLAARTELHGMQVGNEAIGSAGGGGQRNLYPAVVGFSRPRLHVGLDYELDEIAPAPVSTLPAILEGRRVVLYRVFRDHVTYPTTRGFSTWRPVAEAERMWWGTLRKAGHDVEGRSWSLQCDGVWSWIYKRLGMLSQERKVRVWAPLELDDSVGNDQTQIGIWLRSYAAVGGGEETYGTGFSATTITGDDTIAVREALSTAMAAAVADATGPNGAFTATDDQQCVVNVADGTISVRIDGSLASTRFASVRIRMNLDAWKTYGFDPEDQTAREGDDEYFAHMFAAEAGSPGTGYWEGIFTTKENPDNGDVTTYDNGGLPRVWRPRYGGGTMTIRSDAATNPVVLNLGDDIVHHSGQHDRPPAADPDNTSQPYPLGAGVNRQGLWLIEGPRRFNGGEPFDEAQIAVASWREPAQDLAQVAGEPPQILVTRWLRPRDFGLERGTLSSSWVAAANDAENTIYARPLLRLGYMPHGGGYDQAHVLIQRLLYSTGQTDGWSGYEGGTPTMAATSNEPGGVIGARMDGEHEDLGCAIPSSMIQSPATWQSIAGRISNGHRQMSLAILPGQETESVLRGIMVHRGWGWSLSGGQYGLLDYSATVSPAGGIVLDYSNKAVQGKGRGLARHKNPQRTRAFAPKDQYVFRFDWDPVSGEFTQELKQRSPDKGARYRPYPGDRQQQGASQSASTHVAEAHGQRNAAGWPQRIGDIARWYDRGQSWVTAFPVLRRPGQDLWPGSTVILTEPRVASPDGTYGVVGAVGIVTKVHAKQGGRQYFVDILIDGSSVTRLRFNAPMARGRGYNPATRQILIDDDHLEIGNDYSDAEYFVPPSWTTLGGQAQIQVNQWDGNAWTVTATGAVEGVTTTPGSQSITIAAPGLIGTYRRDDDAIITMRPMPNQTAAWVLAFFSPICDESAEWDSGPAQAGYPWT